MKNLALLIICIIIGVGAPTYTNLIYDWGRQVGYAQGESKGYVNGVIDALKVVSHNE